MRDMDGTMDGRGEGQGLGPETTAVVGGMVVVIAVVVEETLSHGVFAAMLLSCKLLPS